MGSPTFKCPHCGYLVTPGPEWATVFEDLSRRQDKTTVQLPCPYCGEFFEAKEEPEILDIPLEQLLDQLVRGTIEALTEGPESRAAWLKMVTDFHVQIPPRGGDPFAAFLEGLQQVLTGTDPAEIDISLNEPFASAWQRLVDEC